MPSQQERSETTRAALCRAFRASLLEKGLEATTTAGVLAETGLSKGALYHHFNGKLEIVEAVYRGESHGAVLRAAASVAPELSPIVRLKQACLAWLKELDQPAVARIVLEIGPEALGMRRVREIEDELSLRLFREALSEAQDRDEIGPLDIDLAARMINGMIAEIAALPRARRSVAATALGPVVDAILAALAEPDPRR
jgi:AcrR family transcriptional regulator